MSNGLENGKLNNYVYLIIIRFHFWFSNHFRSVHLAAFTYYSFIYYYRWTQKAFRNNAGYYAQLWVFDISDILFSKDYSV